MFSLEKYQEITQSIPKSVQTKYEGKTPLCRYCKNLLSRKPHSLPVHRYQKIVLLGLLINSFKDAEFL